MLSNQPRMFLRAEGDMDPQRIQEIERYLQTNFLDLVDLCGEAKFSYGKPRTGMGFRLMSIISASYCAAMDGSVEAAYVLGLLYQRGRPMRCDVQRALYWLSWAAEHGDGEAALAAARLRRAIASGSRERDMAILRGIQNLRRRFPMKSGVA